MHQATVRLQKMEEEHADRCFYFLLDAGEDEAVSVAVRVPESVSCMSAQEALVFAQVELLAFLEDACRKARGGGDLWMRPAYPMSDLVH
jgi:hypothetical protein